LNKAMFDTLHGVRGCLAWLGVIQAHMGWIVLI